MIGLPTRKKNSDWKRIFSSVFFIIGIIAATAIVSMAPAENAFLESSESPLHIASTTKVNLNYEWSEGWKTASKKLSPSSLLDALSLEWDYIQIHDPQTKFRGVLGFVLSNPRKVLGEKPYILPTGMNMAVVTMKGERAQYASFHHFRMGTFSLAEKGSGFSTKNMAADTSPNTRKPWAELRVCTQQELTELQHTQSKWNLQNCLKLAGEDTANSWNLTIGQMPFITPSTKRGDDVGYLPGENWSVGVVGPRVKVNGTWEIKSSDTLPGETVLLDTFGYRERANGKYSMVPDGWDFHVVEATSVRTADESEPIHQGISVSLQTYARSRNLDFAEVSFFENGSAVTRSFAAKLGQVNLVNSQWTWRPSSRLCTPQHGTFELEDNVYLLKANFSTESNDFVSLLSRLTIPVSLYAIEYRFPNYEGFVINKETGETTNFVADGIAEFSFAKSIRKHKSAEQCAQWGEDYGQRFPVIHP